MFCCFYFVDIHYNSFKIKWAGFELTLGDAVFSRQESLLHQTLQDRPDRRPVDQLQHKQVGLRRDRRDKCVKMGLNGRHTHVELEEANPRGRKKGVVSRLLTQQQAVTVICTVFRPGWHTCFRYKGLWEVLLSPLSMHKGVALTLTWHKRKTELLVVQNIMIQS